MAIMKKLLLAAAVVGGLFLWFGLAWAVELNDVYRFGGDFRIAQKPGITVYYPQRCSESIPRIMESLKTVRERLTQVFPNLSGFPFKILITDHDDRDQGSADTTFDLITVGLFEEPFALSTRSYSLEEKCAFRLAYIMILRNLGSSRMALRRRLSLLSIPPWFIEGLALHYAFPMDALHSSRLMEMARSTKLFSLDEMDMFFDRDEISREEMRFQARSMIEYWHSLSTPTAGKSFLSMITKNPIGFSGTFQRAFGFSIQEGFHKYREHMKAFCREKECASIPRPPLVPGLSGGGFCQSFRHLGSDTYAFVSSRRYREEAYDLYLSSPSKRNRPILKNVHPALLVDQEQKKMYLARYIVNYSRQRRLALYEVDFNGKSRQLHPGPGSFRPLGVRNNRLFYVAITNGRWAIRSLNLANPRDFREEYQIPPTIRPLDVVCDFDREELYVLTREGGRSLICRQKKGLARSDFEIVWATEGMLRRLRFVDRSLWFCAEADFHTLQLFQLTTVDGRPSLRQYSRIPGGVWDFDTAGPELIATTLQGRDFRPVTLPRTFTEPPVPADFVTITPAVATPHSDKPYKLEYRSSYWLPKVTRDDQGAVFGVYSYRADTLDRSSIVISPTYGFKSKNWGYVADYMKRFGLFKTGITLEDRVVQKSYLSNTYYERANSTDLHAQYPLALATTITSGVNLANRKIAKGPEKGGQTPSVGHDHSLYVRIDHKGIRTEPFWEIFPQKGRAVSASYRKGVDLLGGDLEYDSMSIRWEEYVPLTGKFVGKLRGWFAEDNKKNGIRRPEDLGIGGSDFLRGYPGSVRYGDSLRAFSAHVGHPLNFSMPSLRNWIQKEIIIGELFWERGDVRSNGREFDFIEDRGFEVRAKGLILRRIPIIVRWGTAWPGNGRPPHSYWGVDFSAVTGLIQ
jgi:hypothetical protein